jgi:hypothetical protein
MVGEVGEGDHLLVPVAVLLLPPTSLSHLGLAPAVRETTSKGGGREGGLGGLRKIPISCEQWGEREEEREGGMTCPHPQVTRVLKPHLPSPLRHPAVRQLTTTEGAREGERVEESEGARQQRREKRSNRVRERREEQGRSGREGGDIMSSRVNWNSGGAQGSMFFLYLFDEGLISACCDQRRNI